MYKFDQTNGFRLRHLQISGHPVLKSMDVTLCDDNSTPPIVYTTGIIGANGTGKSHLMGAIASVFSEIQKAQASESSGTKRFSFTITYDFLGDEYTVSNIHKNGFGVVDKEWSRRYYFATRNGNSIKLEQVRLPERVIASTMTVTDKFLAKTDSFYRYKGIRNERSASTTGTRTIIRKTVESLMDCMSEKNTFKEELKLLLNNLGLEEHLRVSYGMRYKSLFLKPQMNEGQLRDLFDNWQDTFKDRKSIPWGYRNYLTLRDNENAMREAARFLAECARQYDNRRSVIVEYDLMEAPERFQHDSEALKVLTQLDLVSFPSINVVKKGSSYALEDSSSGETHLLCQFIGIMADLRHNSLVLIDEPENSSHPDWQMNYVGWLREIFKEYNDCHFIIATHSPLILANMKPAESTIVRLKRNEKNRILDEGGMKDGCYSWTVDEILQEVMEMKTTSTEDFERAINDFQKAVRDNNREEADSSFDELRLLINPRNELLELLKIQKAAIGDD